MNKWDGLGILIYLMFILIIILAAIFLLVLINHPTYITYYNTNSTSIFRNDSITLSNQNAFVNVKCISQAQVAATSVPTGGFLVSGSYSQSGVIAPKNVDFNETNSY